MTEANPGASVRVLITGLPFEKIPQAPFTNCTLSPTAGRPRASQEYLSDEQIIEVLGIVRIQIEGYSPPKDIDELFDRKTLLENNYEKLPRTSEIGRWVSENQSRNFFASVETEVRERYVYPAGSALTISSGISTNLITQTGLFGTEAPKKEYVTEVSGFAMEFPKAPFKRVRIGLLAKFVNVPSFTLNIVFLFSRLDLQLFLHVAESWAKGMPPTTTEKLPGWRSESFRLSALRENPRLVNTFFG